MLKHRSWVVLFWLSVLVVLTLLLMPLNDNPNPGIQHLDKIVHALIFMGLAVLALRAWPAYWRFSFIGLLVLAALTEVLQGLTGWRTASVADFVADALGLVLAYGFQHIVRKTI